VSVSPGTYSFLPWLRQGLANEIASADGDPAVVLRPQVPVALRLDGERLDGTGVDTLPVQKQVALFGPGDIVGVDARAIVRTEPRAGVTNFEPNHLVHIEFYDEDFPWRYTPAAPDLGHGRLRPWLSLVVLAESEFTEAGVAPGSPLPAITVTNLAALPDPAELWAWAHVHVNRDLGADQAEIVSADGVAVSARLAAVPARDPDLAYARLVCPRRLEEGTAYHAFLVPTFEPGRLAGLGLDLGTTVATQSAWGTADPGPEPATLPIYYRFAFHTGGSGDFETLVRLLRPLPVDPRVGTRDLDVLDPGSGVPGVDNPDLHGILRLGGALRPPDSTPPAPPDVYEQWDRPYPRPLQEALAGLVNLPDDYQRAGVVDPVIAPPLYGRWHALVQRVLRDAGGALTVPEETWVSRLNLDPRFRVAGGLGTRVVQDRQERYMQAAWEQVGAILVAQRRIRFGQLGVRVSQVWHQRYLVASLAPGAQRALSLVAPVTRRLVAGGVTVRYAMAQAYVQPTLTTAALRRIARPGARLVRSLPFDAARPIGALLDRVNRREVSAAPPKAAPPGALTDDEAADLASPARPPLSPLWTLIGALVLAALLFLMAVVVGGAISIVAAAIGLLVTVAGIAGYRILTRLRLAAAAADFIRGDHQTVAAVDALPGAAGFVIADIGQSVPVHAGADSPEAARLKSALRDTFGVREAAASAGRFPDRAVLDLGTVAVRAVAALDPVATVPRRVLSGVSLPARIVAEVGTGLVEPMAYPVIDEPMYEPLAQAGTEMFLPNINLIGTNTVTLLQTNQRFIEAYMVGVNHEFARELLWREYPTDQRGTPFRQFWDVRGYLDPDGQPPAALREALRDIPPLHTWDPSSALGTHDNRNPTGAQEDELVLAVRGELLKRYPTAVIYAQRARWQLTDGRIDNTKERRLVDLTPDQEANPPRTVVLTPSYEAKVDPDIYLFGFALTPSQARGGTGSRPDDDPGWFFVIKERPGEPRFGLDTDQQPVLQTWNDLSWPDLPAALPGTPVSIAASPASFTLNEPTGPDDEKHPQWTDDVHVTWSHDMHAATLAYILFQAPVLVGIHASEMLPR